MRILEAFNCVPKIVKNKVIQISSKPSTIGSCSLSIDLGNLPSSEMSVRLNPRFARRAKASIQASIKYLEAFESLGTVNFNESDNNKPKNLEFSNAMTWATPVLNIDLVHIQPANARHDFGVEIEITEGKKLEKISTRCISEYESLERIKRQSADLNVGLNTYSYVRYVDLTDYLNLDVGDYLIDLSSDLCVESLYPTVDLVMFSDNSLDFKKLCSIKSEEPVNCRLNLEVKEKSKLKFCLLLKKTTPKKLSYTDLNISLNKKTEVGIPSKSDAKVAVVIPSYNCSEYLEKCIQSLQLQTQPPHAIYVVDDCSVDNTVSILDNLKTKLAKEEILLEVCLNSFNVGPYVSKNRVISKKLNHFDYWMMHDADDYCTPNKIEAQIKKLSDPKLSSCYTYANRVDNEGNVILNRGLEARRVYASAMFKKDVFRKCGFFESVRFGADDEFYKRSLAILGKNSVSVIKDPLYKAHVRTSSITQSESKVGLDSLDFLSNDRKSYALSYATRDRADILSLSPFQISKGTPKSIKSLPSIRIHLATYPERLAVLSTVIKSLVPTLSLFDCTLFVCLNEWSEIPQELVKYNQNPNITLFIPNKDLKDNGKFTNLIEGVNFFIDDDLNYTVEYFTHMLDALLTFPKNTAVCLHGYSGSEMRGVNKKLLHFESKTSFHRKVAVAGTGTLGLYLEGDRILKKLSNIGNCKTTGMVDLLFALESVKQNIDIYSIARPNQILMPISRKKSKTLFETNRSREEEMNKLLSAITLIAEVSIDDLDL